MKKIILSVLKVLIFLSLGILLIWLAVRNLTENDKAEITKSLTEANYVWVAFSMLCGILAHLSRAIRWRILLNTLGFNPKTQTTFYAVMIGYLGNLALPRLGEVLRCGILKRYENIPITSSLGTVIAERIIDLFFLFALFILSLFIEYKRMHNYIDENILHPIKNKLHALADSNLLMVMIVITALLLLLFMLRKRIRSNPFAGKIKELAIGFFNGIKTVAKVDKPMAFIFHSFFIWAMYLMSVYISVFTFKETESMSLTDCLAIMCFGSLGVIATPGGIGAYQWIVLQIMLLWGYTTSIGVAFGWVVWLSQTAVVLIVGLLSFALLAINEKKKVNAAAA